MQEENFGTLETTRACYDKMIELKVATPQLIINYAHYLEVSNQASKGMHVSHPFTSLCVLSVRQEMRFYEESFRVYEKGVNLFKWPHVHDIWLFYLTKFVARYGGKKLERARDLFEQVRLMGTHTSCGLPSHSPSPPVCVLMCPLIHSFMYWIDAGCGRCAPQVLEGSVSAVRATRGGVRPGAARTGPL